MIACLAFAGCVSEPAKVGDHSAYRLEKEIMWSTSTPLGERTIRLPAGLYVAIFEDAEGIYLSSPTGKILTGKDGKEEWWGGAYLPFDHSKGINIFQGGGGSYSVECMTVVGPISVMVPDRYFRMKLWGPPKLILLFEKANGSANQALVPTPMSVTPAADAPVAPATGAAHL